MDFFFPDYEERYEEKPPPATLEDVSFPERNDAKTSIEGKEEAANTAEKKLPDTVIKKEQPIQHTNQTLWQLLAHPDGLKNAMLCREILTPKFKEF